MSVENASDPTSVRNHHERGASERRQAEAVEYASGAAPARTSTRAHG
jgi:hypothetical protein